MSQGTVEAAIAAYAAATNALDAEAIAGLLAPDALTVPVPEAAPAEGREAIRWRYGQQIAAADLARMSVAAVRVVGLFPASEEWS